MTSNGQSENTPKKSSTIRVVLGFVFQLLVFVIGTILFAGLVPQWLWIWLVANLLSVIVWIGVRIYRKKRTTELK
jgi:positive regulator of sigma E activity